MNSPSLKNVFFNIAGNYTPQTGLIEECWLEIETSYNSPGRHYHTLHHLENLLQELHSIEAIINGWPAVLFSVYYHDLVYNPLKNSNEEKSATLAAARMQSLQVPGHIIERARQHILATKGHSISLNEDTNLFTDADLCILGKPWADYEVYFEQIRKEYAVYPNLIYNPGRKKVLNHFLSMRRIYKTDHFSTMYEAQARLNLQKELNLL